MPAWRHLWGRAGCDVVAASPSYDGVRIAGENLVEVTLGRDRMMMTTSSFMAVQHHKDCLCRGQPRAQYHPRLLSRAVDWGRLSRSLLRTVKIYKVDDGPFGCSNDTDTSVIPKSDGLSRRTRNTSKKRAQKRPQWKKQRSEILSRRVEGTRSLSHSYVFGVPNGYRDRVQREISRDCGLSPLLDVAGQVTT